MSVLFALQVAAFELHERPVGRDRAQRAEIKLLDVTHCDLARNRFGSPGGILLVLDDINHDRDARQ